MTVVSLRQVNLQSLFDAGLMQPVKRGRPPLYTTNEERILILKKQKKECNQRYLARLREAKNQLVFSECVRSAVEELNLESF